MNALDISTARSFLFVPGNRPDRFPKAAASGADVVILDLEDAVAQPDKEHARDAVRRWLDAGHQAVVRVNAPHTPWYDSDLHAVHERALAVMVPKAEDHRLLEEAGAFLGQGVPLIPLIETALGVRRAEDICRVPSVLRPAFGSVDLSAQLRVDHRSHEALRHARSELVLAAAAADCIAPIDGVTTTLTSPTLLDDDLRHAAELGFSAKLCVHPGQVTAANSAFTPSPEAIAWAQAVLEACKDGGATSHGGEMLDHALVERARTTIARAGRPL
ncbi:CoA ester lyase [Streptomyces shenzhenensis]|uniref:HpcH/HpaI aldolase/citrate lyase family protein n=1 Tax=Streptomyces shenzhenensis TaxID=943815 RepID=UPI0033E116CE